MYRREKWEQSRAELQHYKRRQPERSVLYKLVYNLRDELPLVWEERFQAQYGVLRDEVLKAFDEYLNCGLLCHGAARVHCDSYKHSLLVAYSCKKRGVCPSCSAKRAVKFAEHLYTQVLGEVPLRHIVLTIPKRLRVYFRYDRALSHILFRCAWSAVQQTLGNPDASPGAVLTYQTAGESLNFHPHLHGCLADGLFLADGSFQPFMSIDIPVLTSHFCDGVLAALRKRELISDNDAAQILSQQHSGFGVWLGEPFQDSESKQFVARYIERGPLSLDKLSLDGNIVTYTTNDGTAHEFDGLEFLALLSSHVAKPYESLTRYYGWYSCRARGERLKRTPKEQPAQSEEPQARASATWAACIKRIYEVDPLKCPKCKGQMRIVAFLHNTNEISKIMAALDIPTFSKPAPLPRAPPDTDDFYGSDSDSF